MRTYRHLFLFALIALACSIELLADTGASQDAAASSPAVARSHETKNPVATVALVSPSASKPRALPADEVMPSAMNFHAVPLAVVARVIAARLGRNVEIEANAERPISGDFGHIGLLQALDTAAGQADLSVIDEGAEGLRLIPRSNLSAKIKFASAVPPAAIAPTGKSVDELAAEEQRAAQKIADKKRVELLQLRAKLLREDPEQ